MLNKNAKYINNRLALRPPQMESLSCFVDLCETIDLQEFINIKESFRKLWLQIDRGAEAFGFSTSNASLKEKQENLVTQLTKRYEPLCEEQLKKVHALFQKLSSFERNFPSVCFALATGIGKTRLMGALIAYLVYEKDIKNFFVMAPNLTIYRKLKADLGDLNNPKYVFRGLDKFTTPPRIIDGDNYSEYRQLKLIESEITINVFNISKLNSESGRMRRLNEVLGQSYFDYLRSLKDLCIFMDESHHYHADRGFETINDLYPILGVELTATPQVQKGARKNDFRNVIYEYSLAAALNDGLYVKVPTVFTRRDFRPEEYKPEQLDLEKLNDGISLHEETKSRLDVYARTHGMPIVKPFVLVVAKDTEHSKRIREYLVSDDFFQGYYKDKVLEINSNKRGEEKDENIELLLSLENPSNPIEIVIHVNMLKEGWDVTNLYTIIPLRASASETLTEQTIGRGLRLPYGRRTGYDEVDRLSIVSHDRYDEIIKIANDPNSLVRKVRYIEDQEIPENDDQRETVEMPTAFDTSILDQPLTEQLVFALCGTADPDFVKKKTPEETKKIASTIQSITASTIVNTNKQVRSVEAIREPEIRRDVHNSIISEIVKQYPDVQPKDLNAVVEDAFEACIQILEDKVIPIPEFVIEPHDEIKPVFRHFTLDTQNMSWHPSDDILIGTELQEHGERVTVTLSKTDSVGTDVAENEIVRHIIAHDNIDYSSCVDLIYSLMSDAKTHFLSYLNEDETEKVMRERQRSIADIIYSQINEHIYREEKISYSSVKMRPFSRIESSFGTKFKSDEVCDYREENKASEVKSKIFKGFKKSGHTLCKFDSHTELIFATVLENDDAVLRWLRPAPKQFNIYWGNARVNRYEPDFVVETEKCIYMCETKARKDLNDDDVIKKATAAEEYCRAASKFNAENGGKPWEYVLISHVEIRSNMSFNYLMDNGIRYN